MTKLIALAALLAALAWAVTATASWITAKKAPRALGQGTTRRAVTTAEVNRALLVAHLRTALAGSFAIIMFASMFRVSAGLSGQAGLTAVLLAGLSASGGLLLFSALPAKKLPPQQLAPVAQFNKRAVSVPVAVLLAFAAFVTATSAAAPEYLPWSRGIPPLLTALALAGSALLAGRRLTTTMSLPDPRMNELDQRWRELSLKNLTTFTSGALLGSLGGTLLAASLGMPSTTAASAPAWTATSAAAGATADAAAGAIAGTAAGAALLAAGVVLLVIAGKGALALSSHVRRALAESNRIN